MRHHPVAAPIIAALGLALAVTSCSSSGGNPQVASLGSTTTTQAVASNAAAGILGQTPQKVYEDEVAFAECMRLHGLPAYPDPTPPSSRGLTMSPPADQSSPHYKAAYSTCKHLLPDGGGPPTASEIAAAVATMVREAQCMRTHGFPTFPDPIHTAHQIGFDISGIDRNSPLFQRASATCHLMGG